LFSLDGKRVVKTVAYLLLVVGFFWLGASSLQTQMSTVAAVSNRYEALPKQESFSKREVEQIILQEWSVYRERKPWIFTPACMMFLGGVILDRLRRKHALAHQTI
jgi:hypothetical protein